MARTNYIAKAQKSKYTRTCTTCGHEIQPGEPYKTQKQKVSQRSSIVKVWCKDHSPRPSQTTTSQHLGTIYSAQESFDDTLGGMDANTEPSDLAQALRDAAENIREAAESYRESANNIEEGFGHATSQSEELESKGDEVESWCDEIEAAADEIDSAEFDEQEAHAEAIGEVRAEHDEELVEDGKEEPEPDDPFKYADAEDDVIERDFASEIETKIEEKRQEWWDDLVSEAEVVGQCPV